MLLVLQLEVADDQVYSHLDELEAYLALLGTAKKVREVTVPVRGTHHSKHMEISKAKKRPSHTFVFFFLFQRLKGHIFFLMPYC